MFWFHFLTPFLYQFVRSSVHSSLLYYNTSYLRVKYIVIICFAGTDKLDKASVRNLFGVISLLYINLYMCI